MTSTAFSPAPEGAARYPTTTRLVNRGWIRRSPVQLRAPGAVRSSPRQEGQRRRNLAWCRIRATLAPVTRFRLFARVRPRGDRTRRRRTTSRRRPSRPLSWWCRHSSGRTLEARLWRADPSSGDRPGRCLDDLPTGGPVGPWPLGASIRVSTVATADWIGDFLSRATDRRALKRREAPRTGRKRSQGVRRQAASFAVNHPTVGHSPCSSSAISAPRFPRAEPV